ncbi:MAG TPA: peptidase M28 [Persephonella sp.]|uniref:Peptidase M28 n=1 Tax=Persephonella marina (strain DSM 14350 / EX-H1) TaxID=123214 RepID=C0QS85_PERMH|nr:MULTISPECIES: M28 family peptidase [Persephonella]ACO03446.1 peptidase M28 [Persephonella marina EX-H1]HCB69274.1 peptidase M28 [Persephonella sp.]
MDGNITRNLYTDVEQLCKIRPFRNFYNVGSLDRAAEYIISQFEDLEITVQTYNVNSRKYSNIIASYNTEKEERVIVGAHYDVAGDTPGADDNASGVAGILQIGRFLKLYRPKLKHRVDLVAYTLEEPPFFGTDKMGSYIHAKTLYKEKAKIKVMLSLEMIGYFSDEPDSQQFPLPFFKFFYPDKGNFIGVVGKMGQKKITKRVEELIKKGSSIPVYSINAPVFLLGVDFSDHRNFWKFGYNAVMITDTAFYRNPNYHRRTDTIGTLDFERMSEVVKGIYNVVLNI